jgi:hypothetical protein
VFDVALKAVITRIVAAVPFLGFPVINPVFVYIITKLAGVIYEEISRVVAFSIIDHTVDQERQKYDDAVNQLKDAVKTGDQNDIEKAKAEFKERLKNLVRIRPV